MLQRAACITLLSAAAAAAPCPVSVERRAALAGPPQKLAVSADGRTIYVSLGTRSAVAVLRASDLVVLRSIRVRRGPDGLALASGDRLFVATNFGVDAIDARAEESEPVTNTGYLYQVVYCRRRETVYVPAYTRGLMAINAKTLAVRWIDTARSPVYAALSPDDRFLYVNYRQGGHGGSPGHDVITVLDTDTERPVDIIRGLANVGGVLAVAPDGRTVWANGLDACSSAAYDKKGCPMAPAGIINVLEHPGHKLLRSIGLPGPLHPDSLTFSPDGKVVAVGGNALRIYNAADIRLIGACPDINVRDVAFSPDGLHAFMTRGNASEIVKVRFR